MIKITQYGCCGCEVCADACPFHAITMKADALGFRYPHIEPSKCRDCDICDKVCPMLSGIDSYKTNPIAFAARHKKQDVVSTSRSGGVFTAISDAVLNYGGIVYGATLSDNMHVCHARADKPMARDAFKGSKYTQSQTTDIYKKVRQDLRNGLTVLFSGTPCQCAALDNFLKSKEKKNLILVDIICHGVASDAVWDDFLKMVEKKEKQPIKTVDFRDKMIYGWSGLHRESFIMQDGRKVTLPMTYYQQFLLRPACHECPFASLTRVSDITLGDLWQWKESQTLENANDRGISMVICNTEKGRLLMNSVRNDLKFKILDLKHCLQPNLKRPTPENPLRKEFESDYSRYGFEYVRRKYYRVGLITRIKYEIKRALGKY